MVQYQLTFIKPPYRRIEGQILRFFSNFQRLKLFPPRISRMKFFPLDEHPDSSSPSVHRNSTNDLIQGDLGKTQMEIQTFLF